MAEAVKRTPPPLAARGSPWGDLWRQEDWWAIWIGLGLIAVAAALFVNGASIKWLAVAPQKWSHLSDVGAQLRHNGLRFAVLYGLWSALFGLGAAALGIRLSAFLPSFLALYVAAGLLYFLGLWDQASRYNLEPPLVALGLGLLISNTIGAPRWLRPGLRVEFYIKTGIVLLGASLPLTLIAWAGPVAIVQAAIVSLVTFGVIYFSATRLGLDRRLAATLGTGGAVCGVSGAIAIGGAVGAKKEDVSVAISLVVAWAIVMIFVLPLAARALHLSTGVAGAWIGTSEFADAAGLAAAQTYGGYAGSCGHRRPPRCGRHRLHADESHRPRYLDRGLGVRIIPDRDHPLGTHRNPEPGRCRRDLAALSEVRPGISGRLHDRNAHLPGLRLRRVQEGRAARARRTPAGAANLGIHLCVPQHRLDDAPPRIRLGRRAAVLRVHPRRDRQCRPGIRAVDPGVRRFLAALGPMMRSAAGCRICRHFTNTAPALEAAMPGLASLSSAYAAVRAADGICALHDRYVAASSSCAALTPPARSRSRECDS